MNENIGDCQAPLSLTTQALSDAMGDLSHRYNIYVFDELDSTNSEAKRCFLSEEDTPYAIVAACRQSAGRGRLGRSFFSPDQTGIYFSVLAPIQAELAQAVTVTSAASVAVMRAIRNLTGKQAEIKWVNDLYLEGKKICGILAETVLGLDQRQALILGIGINWNTREFPSDLTAVAGCVEEKHPDRARIIAEILRQLDAFLRCPKDTSWLEEYRRYSCVLRRPIVWMEQGMTYHGIAKAINDRGELIVVCENGTEQLLRTGEISLRVKK